MSKNPEVAKGWGQIATPLPVPTPGGAAKEVRKQRTA